MKKKYLIIIPARKNSSRLKGKNFLLFNKKPMIDYTFRVAKKINISATTILSTNDSKIIKLAKKNNIYVPFKRPENLSGKNIKISSVILHALKWYNEKFKSYPKNFILLQPTSPLRDVSEIKKAIKYYEKISCHSLVTACEPFQNPKDIFYFNKSNLVSAIKKKKNFYFIDGSLYICNVQHFLKNKKLIDKKTKIFLIKKEHGFDIDNKFDLNLAESYSRFVNN